MQTKNTKHLGKHLEGRSTKALEKYSEYLFELAKFTTTGFLLILAYPIVKIFDLLINDWDKYKFIKFDAIFNCLFNALPIFIVWLFILYSQQAISKRLENSAMDILDNLSKNE